MKRSVVAARMATTAMVQFTAIATTTKSDVLVCGEKGVLRKS